MEATGSELRSTSPIAIIGLACRLPGADDADEFWKLLKSQGDAIGPISTDRWDVDYFYHPEPTNPMKMYVREGGFISDVYKFDAEFFGISPREAAQMDPQQRLALELTWEALECAGIVPGTLAGSATSVVMGVSSQDYGALMREQSAALETHSMAGAALSLVSNRVSYVFDLRGPSFSVDSACSSSLVAVHEACESLRRGDAVLAIAGGVNLNLSPFGGIGFSRARMLSPTGRCHAFAAQADGYVRSEGGGIVVLKPLATALADRDVVHAVILGSGVNSDGRTDGISMPNGAAQEELLRRVYLQAGVDPGSVDYVEAHGTGTPVGDPIECMSLGAVIGRARRDGRPCLIGSVKTNIGHLESAAGIAGLVKTVLSLRHREIPASLHFKTPNPAIAFADLNLAVVDKPVTLRDRARLQVMGVNSFGFGGTNAHIILREHRAAPAPDALPRSGLQPLLISARNPAARLALAQRYEERLRRPGADAADICRGAAQARTHHEYRVATYGESALEIAERLGAFVKGDADPTVVAGQATNAPARLALVFSGNGSQWVGMGRDLLEREPMIADWFARIDEFLRPLIGWPLREAFGLNGRADGYDRTEVAQPALFALQVAIYEWLRAHGVSAMAAVGHSVGEVAAAYAAGVLSLAQACRVIAHRSAVQGTTAGAGKMAAVGLSADQAEALLSASDADVVVAAVNGPGSVTLSGDAMALHRVGDRLHAEGVFYRLLALDYAFHSPVMDPVRDELLRRLHGLEPCDGTIPFISTVTGRACRGSELGPRYWWENIREPVRFADAINELSANGITVFLEIGPHPVLTGYVGECLRSLSANGTVIGTLRRHENEPEALRTALLECYTTGVGLDYTALFPPGPRDLDLPTYPWQREHHFLAPRINVSLPVFGPRQHPLLGYRLPSVDPIWHNELQLWQLPYLADHVVQGSIVFPGSGYVEMALSAASRLLDTRAVAIDTLQIRRPIVLSGREAAHLEFALSADDGSFRVSVIDGSAHTASSIAVGRILPTAMPAPVLPVSVAGLRGRMTGPVDSETHYRRCAERGLDYGPAFQGVARLWHARDEALGEIVVPGAILNEVEAYRLHPAIFDACVQVVLAVVGDAAQLGGRALYVPTSIARLRLYGTSASVKWCHMRVRHRRERSIVVDLTLVGNDEIVGEVERLSLRRVDETSESATSYYHWGEQLRPRAAIAAASATMPSLRRLVQEARAETEKRPASDAIVPALEGLAAAYAARAIDELAGADADVAIEGLIERADVPSVPFLQALLALLERHGMLARTETGCLRRMGPRPDPDELWRRLVADYPDRFASLELIARSGKRLVGYLSGNNNEELSPLVREEGLLGQLFDCDPLFEPRNTIAASALESIVQALPVGKSLHVLEVNAGVSGLARVLLPALPADRVDYVYADPDSEVVARAQAEFMDIPGFRCRLLDLARDLVDQDFVSHGFDVVLVGNALFDVGDLKTAASTIAKLLKPGGLMMVFGACSDDILGFVFGMSSRWWAFTDIDLRPNTPLVSADQWLSLAEDAGFEEAIKIGGDTSKEPGWAVFASNAGMRLDASPAPGGDRRRWLLVADAASNATNPASDIAVALAKKFKELGHSVTSAHEHVQDLHLTSNGAHDISISKARQDYTAMFDGCLRSVGTERLQLLFFSRSAGIAGPIPGRDRAYELIRLYQAADEVGIASQLDLWVLTAGAMVAPGRIGPPEPAQAMLWGVARTMANERPGLVCRMIDFDPLEDASSTVAKIIDEVLHLDGEDEVILSGSGRYVNRLCRGLPRHVATVPLSAADAYRIAVGPIDSRHTVGVERFNVPAPARDEVLVRVRASGLNFRDVLQRSTLLPNDAFEGGFAGATLGMEFAGEVLSVGAAVKDRRVGDAVFGFAPAALASHVVTKASAIFPKPPAWSFAAAATVPIAMLTALYSLEYLARLKRGERVLIHGAAGGVGLAAIQYAQWIGAEIFATAGTPQKREFLRRLGVPHVLDSRTLAFADEIRGLTGGEGIDVVLNSIAGEAVPAGISLLRSFGRFIELGKRDFYENKRIGLQPFARNLEFFGVDVDRLLIDRCELAERMFARLWALIREDKLRPLPYRTYPAARATEAFGQMQQSRHIGKVLVSFDGTSPTSGWAPVRPLTLRRDATYLVTGGRSGFGLATAEWMAGQGAGQLVLVGRRAETTPEATRVLSRLRTRGIKIVEAAVDVADGMALADMFRLIDRDMPPLRGIVHAAGVIHDALLPEMSRERFDEVVRPKVLGAWHLHCLTRERPLDFFILYSSAATLIGNPGQSHYVAANLYLEALADYRAAMRLPALAMQWGAIAEVGHVARSPHLARSMTDRLGVVPTRPWLALEAMKRAYAAGATKIAVADLDWTKLSRMTSVAQAPKYSLIGERPNPGSTDDGELNLPDVRVLASSLTPEDAAQLIIPEIVKQTSKVMRIPVAKLAVDRSLVDLGMDSLMMSELHMMMEQKFGLRIPVLELMDGMTVGRIALRIAEQIVSRERSGCGDLHAKGVVDGDVVAEEELDEVLGQPLEH
jgi:acyl transferase domain-containing protein/NADPH:quinone reductase-like Zn-dependent oxidoreductase/acyl carrier protein